MTGPAAVTASAPAPAAKPAAPQALPDRIAGSSRWDTAAQITGRYGAASTIIVANGTDKKGGFDALAANYLAGVVAAPIVLTGPDSLPSEAASAVKTAFTAAKSGGAAGLQVLIMGKADSVSEKVKTQLNAIAQQIAGDKLNHAVRVAGDSRYDTAVNAATLGGDDPTGKAVGQFTIGSGSSTGKAAFLASGTANADALAAGPISNALRIPVYLTSATELAPSVVKALASQGIRNLIVLGGKERVPDAVVAQATAAGVQTVVRIAGSNRFDTAAQLYAFARGTLTGAGGSHYGAAGKAPVFLANGLTGFPDALAVGPLAARAGAVLLTTSATRLEPTTRAFLVANKATLSTVTALGQPATVADAALTAAQTALK